MLEKAIEKIKSEMSKNNNPYIQVVGTFLLNYLDKNPEASEKVLQEGKTIEKSLGDMRKEAEKKKVNNCAVLTDQEGFEIVLKYFGIKGTVPNNNSVIIEFKPNNSKVAKESSVDFDINLEDLLK